MLLTQLTFTFSFLDFRLKLNPKINTDIMKNIIPAMLLLCCNFTIYANADPAISAKVKDNKTALFAFGSYELYDAEDDSLISTFSGDSDITFYLDQLGSQQLLTLRAIEPASPTTQSVKFATVGNSEADWIENNAPWAYKGDASGNYTGWQFTAGTSVQFTVTYHDATAAGGTVLGTDTFTINFEQTTPPPSSFELRINAGGPAITHDGESFTADQYAVGGSAYSNTSALVPPLYQTEHSGSARTFDYAIPLTNGDYDVKLHFAEIYWGATGGGTLGTAQRVFDVSIEGNLVLDNYDINADVNPETPVIKTFSVTITDGTLNINFDGTNAAGGTDQAKVSAIEVISASSGSGQWSTHTDGIYYDSGDVAIGTTPAFNSKLYVRDATTDGGTGLFSWASTSHTSGNVASVKGAWLLSLNHSTGILDESIGANVGAGNETSGTGTVDKAYGVLVDVQDGAGTINDGYGLYIKRVNGTNPYGIYQVESTIENYFAGNVGIGTTAISGWELAVGGKIRAEEVKVETGWADYVFKDDYQLPSLEEVEKHIAEKGHLINIPSAAEVEANGILLGEMNKLLLEKIEELTLYLIELKKKNEQLKEDVQQLLETQEK